MAAGRVRHTNVSPGLVALAAWAVPGAGYWLIGQRDRGVVVGVTIVLLFVLGILLAGVRVIDVPGYDRMGGQVRIDPQGHRIDSMNPGDHYLISNWAITSRGLFGEIAAKPWYVAQILNGPICLISSSASISAARNAIPPSHGRLYEIGTLYTAIAGMLNLLAVIDASHHAARTGEGARR